MENRTRNRVTRWVAWLLTLPLVGFSGYSLYATLRDSDIFYEATGVRPPLRPATHIRPKLRQYGGRQLLWAKGPLDPRDEDSEWFDMTDTPVEVILVNHGIGRDRIRSIDDPVFVKPDDQRLLHKYFLSDSEPERLDQLRVIGYVHEGEAKAYPIPLLNRHELVNDKVGGKPVTVGW